jgi:hypothetical protein
MGGSKDIVAVDLKHSPDFKVRWGEANAEMTQQNGEADRWAMS